MAAAPSTAGSIQRSRYEDMLWLRTNALQRLVAAGVAIGAAWFLYIGVILESLDLRLWSGPVTLALMSLLARRLLGSQGYAAGAAVYVLGVAGSVLLAAWAFPGTPVLLLLALAVGITSLVMGTRAGFVAAGATILILALLGALAPDPLFPGPVLVLTGILASLLAFLLWVAMYPLHMTLEWSWTSYQQARRQTEALQDHRGQLSRTLKDLDAAYGRLEAMAAELERARRAAVEAHRLKGELAANISHELRTPLNLIIGFSEMMALAPHTYEEPLPPAYRGDVQSIYHNARHLSSLIDDVLDLGQIEAGRMGLVRESVAMPELVAEAVAAAGHLLAEKGLYLEVAIPDDLPTIEADPTRVRQVLINLLNNAVRYTDRGGASITAAVDERDITVSVADTGMGIAEEDLPKVFEEFRQLDGSIRRRAGGSGLGLAISKRFVELHGGRMWVTSRAGEGTTFFFSLPRCAELSFRRLPAGHETWARPALAGVASTIAVVDEDPATAQLLGRHLDGCRALPAADLAEAERLVKQEAAQAVLVVESDGQLLRTAEAPVRLGEVPVAMCRLSGRLPSAEMAGVASYLVKPVTQERFLAALAALGEGVESLLIIDDDPEVVRLLARMARLAPRPYRLLSAYGGAQALQILRRERPGALVLDLLMPEVDGRAVLAELQADPNLRGIPTIVVTAMEREAEETRATYLGLTRRDGLSFAELTRCLQAFLRPSQPQPAAGNAPAPPAAPAE